MAQPRRISGPRTTVGYTRVVILWWRRGVSLIVLFVLAGAPAVAAACAELCDPRAGESASTHHAPAAGHHEAGMSDCHGVDTGPVGSVLTAAPCDHHDDAAMGAAFLTAGREDTRILMARTLMLSTAMASAPPALAANRGPHPQPTPPRPTAAPLALRI